MFQKIWGFLKETFIFLKNRPFGCILLGLFAGTILFVFFNIILLSQFFEMINRGMIEEEPFLFKAIKVIVEPFPNVILSICWLLLPVITILVGYFKGIRLTVKNRPWFYFCIGFSLFSIFRFLESIEAFSTTSIWLLIPYYSLEVGGCVLIMISLLCGYKLTTKERLKRLKIPIILILVALIIGVAYSIYRRVGLEDFRILSLLFFTRTTFFLSGCVWGVMVATKMLRNKNGVRL